MTLFSLPQVIYSRHPGDPSMLCYNTGERPDSSARARVQARRVPSFGKFVRACAHQHRGDHLRDQSAMAGTQDTLEPDCDLLIREIMAFMLQNS